MKVLWISVNSSNYNNDSNLHNGEGWVSSLENIVKSYNDVKLSIAFTSRYASENKCIDGVNFYPIKTTSPESDIYILESIKKILDACKPDLIHVFGSEYCFGEIKKETQIPIVIHMQGCIPPYNNAIYPPGYSLADMVLHNILNPKYIFKYIFRGRYPNKRVLREEEILRINTYFMCRTRWDKALVRLYSPQANIFYCSEALREPFMNSDCFWKLRNDCSLRIVTVGGGNLLKGYDLVLKTAKLIKENSLLDFEWVICGPTKKMLETQEKIAGVNCESVNVIPMGKCSADKVKAELLKSDIFVHASYVDNSPNAVCEAQYLGLPIIATNVGGIPSLFDNQYPMEYLVPTNDPYYLASKLIELKADKSTQMQMSRQNIDISHHRHSKENIYSDLLNCYQSIIRKSKI